MILVTSMIVSLDGDDERAGLGDDRRALTTLARREEHFVKREAPLRERRSG